MESLIVQFEFEGCYFGRRGKLVFPFIRVELNSVAQLAVPDIDLYERGCALRLYVEEFNASKAQW